MQPGLHTSVPMADYLAIDALSKHALDLINRSPMEYNLWRTGRIVPEQTEAMRFGSMLHGLVLERRKDWVTRPDEFDSYRSDKARAWRDSQTQPVLTLKEVNELARIHDAIKADPLVSTLLAPGSGLPEVTMIAEMGGRLFKGRADWLNVSGGYMVDLKTTTDASTHAFSREISFRRYAVQAALYWKIQQALGNDGVRTFYFVAVEKVAPYRINVRKLKDSAIDVGLARLEKDLEVLERCERTNTWPGLSGAGPDIEEIDLPAWEYMETEPELTGAVIA